jgi:ABC-type bacteriocin/lantibiotic exporter with double-glycine peptidase domain
MRVLRESCQGVTMLIIAHRVGTVRDCDQILEIRDGRVVDSYQGISPINGAATLIAAPVLN